jgi:hypothetical protein
VLAPGSSPHASYQRAALCAPFDGPAVLLFYKQRTRLPRRHPIFAPGA